MLRVWGRKTSSNVQAVMWCVAELGLTSERYDVGHIYGGNDTPEFLTMNPNGTVPVLRDGDGQDFGAPIWETGAILRYLSHRSASGSFWPSDPLARAEVDMWAEWAKINVAHGFTAPIFWRVVRTAPAKRDPAAIGAAIAALTPKLDIAERRLAARDYLCGSALTLADIQFGHLLYRYYDIDISRPEHPAIRAYYDRLTTRAAFREHVMVSYEELRVL
jgi:glutathione S-transferase